MASLGLQFADHLLEGTLAQRLADWRSDGLSWERIARELEKLTDGQIDVSFDTVKKWAAQLSTTEAAS